MEESRASRLDYDPEVIQRVWCLGQEIAGNDAALWRKDEQGAWIHRLEYRNRRSQFGWEIADYGYHLRRVGMASLRPLQWQNHLDLQVASHQHSVITADGLNNVRRLL
jgi:hypothetical protein